MLPASALTLIVTLLIGSIVLAPNELTLAGRAARATALYMSNIFFAVNAADYFAPDVKSNPMLHTWSLAVEEQFYLFWPTMIVLSLLFRRSKKALLVLLSGLTIISFGTCMWFTADGGTFAPAHAELPSSRRQVRRHRSFARRMARWDQTDIGNADNGGSSGGSDA